MMKKLFLWVATAVLFLLVLTLSANAAPELAPAAQDQPPEAENLRIQAETLLDQMSVADRVGQLFLIAFDGDSAPADSEIAALILEDRVGGVVLLAANDNITGYGDLENVPLQLAELNNDLQRLAILGLTTAVNEAGGDNLDPEAVPPTRNPTPAIEIPLFVATHQEGDGAPHSEIFNGLTELPSNMALGATWEPALAYQVGAVAGQELSALGINMLLGPSLDVLEQTQQFNSSDLGARAFGGDPYWVGLMGRAYTAGIHDGSGNGIAVVPKHFPGYGDSDRQLHEEIPTVRKSLDQLTQVELAPFFAVTSEGIGSSNTADGLLTTHIRYQGFQGNIRATTNPVSLDPQALSALMALPELAAWREGGGLIVSDALGVRAVERFYDDTEQVFPHRVVAKDAFLAGNDLLYLADFSLGSGNGAEAVANIRDTIGWFRERYVTEVAFQEQVDTAVLRILQLKLRLYGEDFSVENVLVDPLVLAQQVGVNSGVVFSVAQDGVTLIAPQVGELSERIPQLPGSADRIAIFTDERLVQQCSFCPQQTILGSNDFADRIVSLYGPEGSNQIGADQISSYTFDELKQFLDEDGPIFYNTIPLAPTLSPESTPTADTDPTSTPLPTPTPPVSYLVQETLADVDWIIFAMLDDDPQALAIHEFLARRPDLVRNKQVIVFAFNAPYYLDTTEITQLTAFYGVYSQADPFVDAAVRALFQEFPLAGSSPVDIEGVSYDLFLRTQPDPEQIIGLTIVNQEENDSTTDPFDVSVGDTLRLQTGVIQDRNGNPVPNGTIVRFIQRDRVQGIVNIIAEVPTAAGVAQLDYVLEARTEGGQFRIAVESEESTISQEVDITVASNEAGGAQIQIINPTVVPTPEAELEGSPTPTMEPTATSTTPATNPPQQPGSESIEPTLRIALSEFQMLTAVFFGVLITAFAGTLLGPRLHYHMAEQVGFPLWGIVAGLFFYNYYALSLPGAGFLDRWGSWAGLITTLFGGGLGLIIYHFTVQIQQKR